jgi:hypothetical protein
LSQKLEAEALEDNPKVKEIPQLYFRENFTMADAATFQSIIDTYSYQLLLEKVCQLKTILLAKQNLTPKCISVVTLFRHY